MINIRFAANNEAPDIISFIRKHWSAKHVFVTHPELFAYCYDAGLPHLCYAVAEKDGEITGVCGYIQSVIKKTPDIWIALWKTAETEAPGLGMKLINYLKKESGFVSCCGAAQNVLPIYRYMGFSVGRLNHYYRLKKSGRFIIAKIKNPGNPPFISSVNCSLKKIDKPDRLRRYLSPGVFNIQKPLKDFKYLEKRYFNHIKYKYSVYGICLNGFNPGSFLVTRDADYNGAKALRIVDYWGNENDFAHIGTEIDRLICENNYEYADFYQFGMSEKTVKSAGFVLRDENDPNIIPNYFEPFEQRNIEIYFAASGIGIHRFRMFKGDGDQDRPNIM